MTPSLLPPCPTFEETCETVAKQFSQMSSDAYRDGDETRGDHLFALATWWALSGEAREFIPNRPQGLRLGRRP